MTTTFWIEKAWGDSVDNANLNDVKVAINETSKMDDEHGAFWAGDMVSENVLEVHKSLEMFYVKNANAETQLKVTLENWNEVEMFYKLFFENKFEEIETEFKRKLSKR